VRATDRVLSGNKNKFIYIHIRFSDDLIHFFLLYLAIDGLFIYIHYSVKTAVHTALYRLQYITTNYQLTCHCSVISAKFK